MGGRRSVRVFLSAAFRHMNAERDYLIKATFPALRERLLPHRVELHNTDLPGGVSEDEALNEKVVRLCLEQGDDCPFFLAFNGHCYGWVYDRVSRNWAKLVGLDDFGEEVETCLWDAIRAELKLPDTPATVDPLDAEADLHEQFLELRTRLYVGRDALYGQLREFALAEGETPLVLTGESGLGKSAALARFVREFRREHPDRFVLGHFVGASPGTTSLPTMLHRITQELQRRFALMLSSAGSPDAIVRSFQLAITSLPEPARVVLVLDALNQLDADDHTATLAWLPEVLPANVRVLLSASTDPQRVPRVLMAFGERDVVAVPMEPLTRDERRDLVKAMPKPGAKALDERQNDALLANPATGNPLFLRMALEELRDHGSFEHLNMHSARLPRACDALTRLFERTFERLEKEFGSKLVAEVVCLLACARRGLSGPELVELTSHLLEDEVDDLYPLLHQLEAYLHRRDGRFDFSHLSIRRAAERSYLKWHTVEDQHDPWLRWNPNRKQPAGDPTQPELQTRDWLIAWFQCERETTRAIDELPWQLAQLGMWRELFELLGDLSFFNAAWTASELEVRRAWSLVKTAGRLEPITAYRNVLAEPGAHDVGTLWRLGTFLKDSGYGTELLSLWSVLIERFRAARDDARLQGCLGNKAQILQTNGDLDGAILLLKEQEAVYRRLNDPSCLAASLANQASPVALALPWAG